MEFKEFGDKAQGMVETAGGRTTTAGKMLDEFNEAMPTMRALGFVVKICTSAWDCCRKSVRSWWHD